MINLRDVYTKQLIQFRSNYEIKDESLFFLYEILDKIKNNHSFELNAINEMRPTGYKVTKEGPSEEIILTEIEENALNKILKEKKIPEPSVIVKEYLDPLNIKEHVPLYLFVKDYKDFRYLDIGKILGDTEIIEITDPRETETNSGIILYAFNHTSSRFDLSLGSKYLKALRNENPKFEIFILHFFQTERETVPEKTEFGKVFGFNYNREYNFPGSVENNRSMRKLTREIYHSIFLKDIIKHTIRKEHIITTEHTKKLRQIKKEDLELNEIFKEKHIETKFSVKTELEPLKLKEDVVLYICLKGNFYILNLQKSFFGNTKTIDITTNPPENPENVGVILYIFNHPNYTFEFSLGEKQLETVKQSYPSSEILIIHMQYAGVDTDVIRQYEFKGSTVFSFRYDYDKKFPGSNLNNESMGRLVYELYRFIYLRNKIKKN